MKESEVIQDENHAHPASDQARHDPIEPTHKSILGAALPMTFAYMAEPIIALSDTIVIGQLNDAILTAGLGIGSLLFGFVLTPFNFLRSGSTGLTAQAYGANDANELHATLIRYALLGLLIGAIIVLVQQPIIWAAKAFYDQNDQVFTITAQYFSIRVYAIPLILLSFAGFGWLIGIGKNSAVLVLAFVLAFSNVVLNIYLGLYLEWGIVGVAWASVLAEFIVLLMTAFIIQKHINWSFFPAFSEIKNSKQIVRMLNLNIDIMLRSLALIFAFSWFGRQSGQFGEITVAANVILLNFFLVIGYCLDGLATAAEQFGGRAIGAQRLDQFRLSIKLTAFWSGVIAFGLSCIFFIGEAWFIAAMTTVHDLRIETSLFYIWVILLPLTGVMPFLLDGIYIGSTWSRHMRNTMLFSLVMFIIFCALLIPIFHNHGLWLALNLFMVARGLSLLYFLPGLTRITFGRIKESTTH